MAECVTLRPGRAAYHVVVVAGSWCIGAAVLLLLLLFAAFAAGRRSLAGDQVRALCGWLLSSDTFCGWLLSSVVVCRIARFPSWRGAAGPRLTTFVCV